MPRRGSVRKGDKTTPKHLTSYTIHHTIHTTTLSNTPAEPILKQNISPLSYIYPPACFPRTLSAYGYKTPHAHTHTHINPTTPFSPLPSTPTSNSSTHQDKTQTHTLDTKHKDKKTNDRPHPYPAPSPPPYCTRKNPIHARLCFEQYKYTRKKQQHHTQLPSAKKHQTQTPMLPAVFPSISSPGPPPR